MKITIVCICLALFIMTTIAENFECNEGDVKQLDCNSCRCVKGGRWACTRKHCIHKRSEETCNDGDQKMLDCNNCYCTNSKWACTKMQCLPKDRIATETNTFSCTPGQTFKKDCNNCTCTQDGKNAICTLKACLPDN